MEPRQVVDAQALVSVDQAVAAVEQLLRGKKRCDREVTPATRFADLGLDSLDIAELFVIVEETIDQELDPNSAESIELVGDLTQLRGA